MASSARSSGAPSADGSDARQLVVPRRRERILGFDRLNGIEIADLADRLVEVWPQNDGDSDAIDEAREHLDALAASTDRLVQIVTDLRTELDRIERLHATQA